MRLMLAAGFDAEQVAVVANVAVLILGGAAALGFLVWLMRGERWRNPLAGAVSSGEGPTVYHVLLVLAAFVAFEMTAMAIAVGGQPPDIVDQPGTPAWHMSQVADSVVRLILVVAMVWILAQHRSFPWQTRRIAGWRPVAAAVVAVLVITTVCTVQLQACTIVWTALHPQEVPPVHPVLQAIRNSAWGEWGLWQLFIGAVIIAPVSEELFFRGLVLQAVWRHTQHAWLSVLFSGLTFGMIHGQPQDVLPLCTMGVILGFVRLRTRSLTACVVAHALFNVRTMIMAIFFPELLKGP